MFLIEKVPKVAEKERNSSPVGYSLLSVEKITTSNKGSCTHWPIKSFFCPYTLDYTVLLIANYYLTIRTKHFNICNLLFKEIPLSGFLSSSRAFNKNSQIYVLLLIID